MKFSVMTYNIHIAVPYGYKIWEYIPSPSDLENIASVIKSSNPDIIGLNEVDRYYGPKENSRSGYMHISLELAKLLRLKYAFGSTRDDGEWPGPGMTDFIEWGDLGNPKYTRDPQGAFGNAQLSKHDIRNAVNFSLPNQPGNEKRALLMTEQIIQGYTFHIYNTHLQNPGLPNSEKDRWMQAQEIIRIIQADKTEHKILMGDFNWDTDKVIEGFSYVPEHYFIPEIVSMGFVDSAKINPQPANTIYSSNPKWRIDYIFVSPNLRIVESQVIQSLASDHLPVITTLEL